MKHSGLAKFSKYSLIVGNVILLILGLFVLGCGVVTLFGPNPSHIFLIGGSTLVIVALHGCKGAVQENPKLLKIYGWVMLVLLASKFVVVVISMIQQNNPMAGLFKVSDVKKGFDVYGQDPIMTDSVDEIQHTLSCCGFYEPKSMIQSDGTYPRSCCSSQYESCRDPFPNGCSLKIRNTLSPMIIGFWVEFALTVVADILLASMAFYFASIIQRKTEAESTQPLHKYSQLEC